MADGTTIKACCTALYQSNWVRLLLGESFHPGGLALTSRLGTLLGLGPNSVVLDVACGRGTSAIHLAQTYGCRVIGVDLSGESIAAAQQAYREATKRLSALPLIEFRVGDGEAIPVESSSVDAVICECAFCTFPDKIRASREFVRVLRPGGRLGLSDVTRSAHLPAELEGLLAWVACIADARSVDEYTGYLTDAGFRRVAVENRDDALHEMVKNIQQRLCAVEILTKIGTVDLPTSTVEGAKSMAHAAAAAVRNGKLGYSLLTAIK